MKKLKTIIYSLLIIVSFCLSCKKDKSPLIEASGTIQYFGDISSDGCGWTIKVNSFSYKPIKELPENLKIKGLSVDFTYRKLNGKYLCGVDYIEIVEIKTRN